LLGLARGLSRLERGLGLLACGLGPGGSLAVGLLEPLVGLEMTSDH
jgi:hypothetical protein